LVFADEFAVVVDPGSAAFGRPSSDGDDDDLAGGRDPGAACRSEAAGVSTCVMKAKAVATEATIAATTHHLLETDRRLRPLRIAAPSA